MTVLPFSPIRFATFNSALYRQTPGQLIEQLSFPHHPQIEKVAEIIQWVRPDILVLQEFDYDPEGKALHLFQENYLKISHHGAPPLTFLNTYAFSSNSGLPSGMDMDNDGRNDSPSDALGFGLYPGQYAFAILSNYPILEDNIRTFQKFLWKNMPRARLPHFPTGEPWYSQEKLAILRLSSKNHVDVPIQFPTTLLHILIAHPTPPAFDGQEFRNRLRNFDEIRLLTDYLTPETAYYLYDDQGRLGGLETTDHFVIMGDMNADPYVGNSLKGAIEQLLHHPRVNSQVNEIIPASQGSIENTLLHPEISSSYPMPLVHHTASWGLRVDYILPSRELTIHDSAVFWPESTHALHYLVEHDVSSDHRLVWADIYLPRKTDS